MMIEHKQLRALLQRYRDLLTHYLALKNLHHSWLLVIKKLEEVLLDDADIEDEIVLSDTTLRDTVSYIQKKIISNKKIISPFLQKQAITLQNRITTIDNFSLAMTRHIDAIKYILENTKVDEKELLIETPLLEQQYQVLKLSHEINWQKNNDFHEIKELQQILQPFANLENSLYSAEAFKKQLQKNPELQNLHKLMAQFELTYVDIRKKYEQVIASWQLAETLSNELVKELNLEKQLKEELELKLQQEQQAKITPIPTTPTLMPFSHSRNDKEKE